MNEEAQSPILGPAEHRRLLTQLVAGLLASGNYTRDSDNTPELIYSDNGPDWKRNGHARRYEQPEALVDAVRLLSDIQYEVGDVEVCEVCDKRPCGCKLAVNPPSATKPASA